MRVVWGVLLVLALVVGATMIGNTAYQAGLAQGLAESAQGSSPGTGGGPYVPYPYYGPYFYHGPFGFGFFGFLFPLLFIFLIFALLRGLFWSGRWGGYHGYWKSGVPPMFDEWHRKAHETQEHGPKTSM